MLRRIWAIALNTFREAARIRVLYAIFIVAAGANLLSLVVGQMAIHEEARVARDVGLAVISLFGAPTAIALGLFLLYSEVQRRTIHAIVSKPIERWEFVIGKYLGMALVLTVLVATFTVALLGVLAWQHVGMSAAVVEAIVLAWGEVLTVAAIAIFFSSFSSPVLSAIFASSMWIIGRLTPDIENATRAASGLIRGIARVALEIVPDLHLFSPSGRVIEGAPISVHGDFVSWGYVAMAWAHGLGWIVGLLALACVLFHRRDFA